MLNETRFMSRKLLFALLVAVLLCGSVNAQLSTATLFGTITDATGAAIPKANVTITQTDTGFVRTVVTKTAAIIARTLVLVFST